MENLLRLIGGMLVALIPGAVPVAMAALVVRWVYKKFTGRKTITSKGETP